MGHAPLMRAAGAVVAAAHMACGLVGWLAFGVPGSMLLFGLSAVITLALALAAAPLLEPRRRDGGAPTRSGDDPPEPPWWPDFERGLRAHCEDQRLTSVRADP